MLQFVSVPNTPNISDASAGALAVGQDEGDGDGLLSGAKDSKAVGRGRRQKKPSTLEVIGCNRYQPKWLVSVSAAQLRRVEEKCVVFKLSDSDS